MNRFIALFCVTLLVLVPGLSSRAQRRPSTPQPKAVYLPFAEAKQVVSTLADILPEGLKGKSEAELATAWPQWIVRRDADIRARLAQGDEDSLINFLLFGTAFTKQPRLTLAQIPRLKDVPITARKDENSSEDAIVGLVRARVADLVRAAALPSASNDRLMFTRRILNSQKGFRLETPRGRAQAQQFLIEGLKRVINENAGYSRVLESARLQGDASGEFAERSRLFRTRGLSSDTTLLPNHAIEQALKDIAARGLLSPGAVSRVAVIGPGLDFTDKQEGYDFYPQQTIQPFAIIDSLMRLNLATPGKIQLVTFDLSPRVNDHLRRARERALKGQGYVLQLPRDEQAQWTPEAIRYWEQFGNQVGDSIPPVSIPGALGGLRIRAIRVRAPIVTSIRAVDTNIVLQRLEVTPAEQFDLVIATNILVYYDNFEQSLAMLNMERMVKPGGLLLSNNALLEFPFFKLRSAGVTSVGYSNRPDDGDHIVWYRRSP